MKTFIGRKKYLKALTDLQLKATSSLVVCKGRRRIGKSRLISEFGKCFEKYLSIQGIPPVKGQTNQDQLDNFTESLSLQSRLPRVKVDSWAQAFELLFSTVDGKSTLILLDEISWIGKHDINFPGILKNAWDRYQGEYKNLILCLCGSVSTWIEENILNSTHFVGRISSVITLEELDVVESKQFFTQARSTASSHEILKFLCVTGGVPKYLEELSYSETFEKNINHLAFSKHGFLYLEFDRLFNSSFEKERAVYHDLVRCLQTETLSLSQITAKLGRTAGGNYSKYLAHLVQAGFVKRDIVWNTDGEKAKSDHYRISDNYTRFYFRCIKPKRALIEKNIAGTVKFENLTNWRSIIGLQFENLVYSNLHLVIKSLSLSPGDVLSLGPYFQKRTTKNKGAVQIDLMIVSKFDTIYLCEIKFQKQITRAVTKEIQRKVRYLDRAKYVSVRPVLIYAGELADSVAGDEFYFRQIDFAEYLDSSNYQ